ncbi:hypothetical protein Rsub_05632 [Raphidocelis subcapitata]|uniref:Calcineurin-like phosphoesterase domain-containing protein n=1 Tax=Raphidocelis subcapitata TaxID=307507 RepID=A0A2V0NZF6_9CHLO|nr:hypothetical protein Rsub_05632 [Raphidocelis subcapitata]|eukprot:GBF93021.1 hypothetical protein Rsub_05632 [Raphidocelis subcapitata]
MPFTAAAAAAAAARRALPAAAAAAGRPLPLPWWLRPGLAPRSGTAAAARARTTAAAPGAVPADDEAPAPAPAAPSPARAPAARKPRRARAGAPSPTDAAGAAGAGAAAAREPAAAAGPPPQLPLAAGPTDPAFAGVTGWVAFSDLHVSHRTLEVSLEVLRRVASEAGARGAGVLFLGDFWDRRGDLPVGPLNEVIREMRSWEAPVLMLPGNHDQVDLAGRNHALTPLAAACRAAHVFSEPTLWAGALWLPYRREESQLRAALAAAAAAAAAAAPPRAVFAHADVLAARVNAAHQAASGLPAGVFPRDVPVYMGHYHLPQTVPGTRITYIGSPYQVSRSEAGQSKRLLLLSPDWQQSGEVALDLGPRHYTFLTPAAAAVAGAEAGEPAAAASPLAAAAAAAAAPAVAEPAAVRALLGGGALRAGDRVRVSLAAGEGGADELGELKRAAQAAGVDLEVVMRPPARAARIEAAEQLSMRQLLGAYAAATGMRGEVLQAAEGVLQDLGASAAAPPPSVRLDFEGLEVEGFGPFRDLVSYPLASRGLVAVTGRNDDDESSESNGAGKTSLLTALLWAMKAGDRLTQPQAVNEDRRSARVKVWGRLNGAPFAVERATRLGGGGKASSRLNVWIDGRDHTQQAIDLTERLLAERFASGLLARTIFFGQEELMAMLSARDKDFKELLGAVVDTACWDSARSAAAARLRGANADVARLEGEARYLASALAGSEAAAAAAREEEAAWEAARVRQRAGAEAAAEEARRELRGQLLAGLGLRAQLLGWLEASRALEAALREGRAEAAAARDAAAARLAASEAACAQAVARLAAARGEKELQEGALQRKRRGRAEEERARAAAGAAPPPDAGAAPLPSFDEGAAAARAAALQGAWDAARGAYERLQRRALELGAGLAAARGRLWQYELLMPPGGTGPVNGSASGDGGGAGGSPSRPGSPQGAARRPAPLPPRPVRVVAAAAATAAAPATAPAPAPAARHEACAPLGGGAAGGGGGFAASGGPVCDKCLQPVDARAFAANLDAMRSEAHAAAAEHAAAEAAARDAEAAARAAEVEVHREREAAAAGRAAVAEARERLMRERSAEAHAAAAAAAERRLAEQRAADAAEQSAVAAAAEALAAAAEAAAARQAEVGAARDGAARAAAEVDTLDRRLQALPAAQASVQAAADMPLQFAAEMEHQHRWPGLKAEVVGEWEQQRQAGGRPRPPQPGDLSATAADNPQPLTQRVYEEWAPAAQSAARALAHATAEAARVPAASLNPVTRAREGHEAQAASQRTALAAASDARRAQEAEARVLKEVDAAFGRAGIPSFVLEGLLGELQAKTSEHLQQLASGMALELRATRELGGAAAAAAGRGGRRGRGAAAAAAADDDGGAEDGAAGSRDGGGSPEPGGLTKEEILKVVKVRAANGELRERSVAQLSGGEKKRAALALALAFTQVAAARGRLSTNLIVLDEVLEKLDSEGCTRVASLLASLPHASKLVVGQAHSFVTDTFGVVDTVVKRGGQAYIELGPGAEALLQPPPDMDSASTSSTRGATEAADAADAEVAAAVAAAAPPAAAGAPTAAGRMTPGRRGRPRKTAAAAAE